MRSRRGWSHLANVSLRACRWALQQRVGNTTRKLVLVALADAHNERTGLCFPSVTSLAETVETSGRTIIRCLNELADAGFIERQTRHGKHGRRTTNSYTLNMDANEEAVSVLTEVERAVAAWNETAQAHDLPVVRSIDGERRAMIEDRLATEGFDGWSDALRRVEASPFLLGRKGGFRCTIDFLARKRTFDRVREGNYEAANDAGSDLMGALDDLAEQVDGA